MRTRVFAVWVVSCRKEWRFEGGACPLEEGDYFEGGHVFLDLLDSACAGDDGGDSRVLGAPGDRELGGCAPELVCALKDAADLVGAVGIHDVLS